MATRLVIEDTSVYEIDEECLKQKKEKKSRNENIGIAWEKEKFIVQRKKEPAS